MSDWTKDLLYSMGFCAVLGGAFYITVYMLCQFIGVLVP